MADAFRVIVTVAPGSKPVPEIITGITVFLVPEPGTTDKTIGPGFVEVNPFVRIPDFPSGFVTATVQIWAGSLVRSKVQVIELPDVVTPVAAIPAKFEDVFSFAVAPETKFAPVMVML